nr:hypothetical protein Iba_scaffold3049CG0240 [Ipomoea batatas]
MNTSTSPRVRLLGFHHRFTLDTPDREPPASGVKETNTSVEKRRKERSERVRGEDNSENWESERSKRDVAAAL